MWSGDNSVSNWRTSPVPWGACIRWRVVENRLGSSEVRHEVVGRTFSKSVDPVVEESWFPGISARAQEYLLHEGCTEDARVALLETVFVLIALQQGRASGVPSTRRADHIAPRGSARPLPSSLPASCWEQLDEVNLEEWFLRRVPTLKKCPHFMRGRLRHCFAVALRERYRAKGAQDSRAEERAWKLFGLVPVMLLHRPRGTALLSAGSWQGRWRASLGKPSKQLAPPSNLHCQREPAQIASGTQSGLSQTRTPCARCCPSMALVLTTMCTEGPCWQSCTRFLVCKGCFRSSEQPMPTPRVTFGKMRLGCNTASSQPKGANKATL